MTRRQRAARAGAAVAAVGLGLGAAACASAPPTAAPEGAEVTAVPVAPLPLDLEEAAAEEAAPPIAEASAASPPASDRDLAPAGRASSTRSSAGGSDEARTTAGAPAPAPTDRRPSAATPVLIVVDEGGSETRPAPGELAQRTRRDAAAARGASPRITNDNLGDYARRGRVSMGGTPAAGESAAVQEDAAAQPDGAAPAAAAATAAEPPRDEAWWRSRARALREEWRATVDEIRELEEAAADLRWRFYAADDPWVRDGEVKPEWDRVLDRLSQARERLGSYPQRLDELAEEGRREGALPGWLREGMELEPRPEELPEPPADPAEPVEPRATDDGRGDGR